MGPMPQNLFAPQLQGPQGLQLTPPMGAAPQGQPPAGPQAAPPPQPAPQPPPQDGSMGDLDPLMVRRLADAYGISDDEAAMMLRYKRAEALAGTPTPQGKQVGDVFVHSNPLEMLGAGARQMVGYKQMGDIADQRSALGQRRVKDALAGYGVMGAQVDPNDLKF